MKKALPKSRKKAVAAPKKPALEKKIALVKKTVLKKESPKKVSAQAKKKPLQKKVIKARKEKTAPKTSALKDKGEIVLPEKASKKAIVRSNKLRIQLDEYIHDSVYRVAYVSAFCFIVVGSAFALSDSSSISLSINSQKGEVFSSIVDNTAAVVPESKEHAFTFLSEFPLVVSTPQTINFTKDHYHDVVITLYRVGGEHTELTYEKIINDKYELNIPTNVGAGYYELRAHLKNPDTQKNSIVSSPEFFIGTPEEKSLLDSIPQVESIDIPLVTSNQESQNEESITDASDRATSSIPASEPVKNTAADTSTSLATEEHLLATSKNILSGTEIIYLNTFQESVSAGLYYRQLNSLDYRYVTSAAKRGENWSFIFDSKNIPDGQYAFVSRVEEGDVVKESPSFFLIVDNSVVSATSTEQVTGEEVVMQTREYLGIDEAIIESSAGFSDIVNQFVEQLMQENKIEIEELLKRYASAVQAGDKSLVFYALQQLENKQRLIITSTLQNDDLRSYSDDIEIALKDRMYSLLTQIDAFEQSRSEESAETSSIDTDKDGISDFDETQEYSTNPLSPDSDNDGFLDGIEIIQGFDPISATTEGVVTFNSPKDSVEMEREDIIQVTAVSVVTPSSSSGESKVRVEISGTSLPDSFVSLFIFSTTTVITVRTDETGAFAHTFEKKLEDGRHDVFAALTDNAGILIAQSYPYSFIKQESVFTSVTGVEGGKKDSEVERQFVWMPEDESRNDSDNITIIGISVIALGIILLLLSVGLRRKKDDIDLLTPRVNVHKDSMILTDTKVSKTKSAKTKK